MGGRHQQDGHHGWRLTSEVQSEAVGGFLPAGSRNPVVPPTLVWMDGGEALRRSYVSLQLLHRCTVKLESLLLENTLDSFPRFILLCTCAHVGQLISLHIFPSFHPSPLFLSLTHRSDHHEGVFHRSNTETHHLWRYFWEAGFRLNVRGRAGFHPLC